MVRVGGWYAVAPAVIVVGAAVLLTIPYLAVAVLLGLVLGVLAALGWAVVAASRMLVRAVSRRGGSREPLPVALTVTPHERRSGRRDQ
jgi:drug/metabolite transporter (DMT)-like permease